MGAKSSIEWTDASWTPIRARNRKTGKVGWHCEHSTTGCEFCYAEGINKRLGTGLTFKPGHRKDIEIFLDEEMLLAPLRWKKPRMVFVCSMTDLFADFVKDEWIDRIFAVMALCPQHTFQVLTKRAERMQRYFNGPYPNDDGVMARIAAETFAFAPVGTLRPNRYYIVERPVGPINAQGQPEFGWRRFMRPTPLPNVWLGVSVERQPEADERIPLLLKTPALVRFVSAEPLLGPIDLRQYLRLEPLGHPESPWLCRAPLDWVIVGGESGPGARPMHPDWVRSIRDQCLKHESWARFFFKQWGEWKEGSDFRPDARAVLTDGRFLDPSPDVLSEADRAAPVSPCNPTMMRRVGKKRAGRLLDGAEYSQFPQVSEGPHI